MSEAMGTGYGKRPNGLDARLGQSWYPLETHCATSLSALERHSPYEVIDHVMDGVARVPQF
eukprot:1188700-Amphidinium_carterae.3